MLHRFVVTSWTIENAAPRWAPAGWDTKSKKHSNKHNVHIVRPADIGAYLIQRDLDIETIFQPMRSGTVQGNVPRRCAILSFSPERFRAKWVPVRVKKTGQSKKIELRL
jgi:hypothetical protein